MTPPFLRQLTLRLLLVLAFASSGSLFAKAIFGFNYWPYQRHAGVLIGTNWNELSQKDIQTDLDQMASLGTEMVRVMIWPYDPISGWKQLPEGKGSEFTPNYYSFLSNLSAYLPELEKRKIKAAITFGDNWWHKKGANKPGLWNDSYNGDFERYVSDVIFWMSGIIRSAEASTPNNIVYYDIHNEASLHWNPQMWDYLKVVLAKVDVPKGKLGLSTMLQGQGCGGKDDTPQIQEVFENKNLNFIEYHSYPTGCTPDFEKGLKNHKSAFPNTKVLMGEFGLKSSNKESEKLQADYLEKISLFVKNEKELYAGLHWTFWDGMGGWPDQFYGIGYSPDKPKNAYEVIAEQFSLLANPGFEKMSGKQASSWSLSTDGGATLERIEDAQKAASRQAYLRLTTTKSGKSILRSDRMLLPSGAQLAFADIYLRGEDVQVNLMVEELDASGKKIKQTEFPKVEVQAQIWRNYLKLSGPAQAKIGPETKFLQFAVQLETKTEKSFLELDAASFHAR